MRRKRGRYASQRGGRGLRLIKARRAHYSRSHLPRGHPVRLAEARRLRINRRLARRRY